MVERDSIPRWADLTIQLEPEVEWTAVAPLLQELQDRLPDTPMSVRRAGPRIAAGGPGYDIEPILMTIIVVTTLTTLVQETVRDTIYPFLKDKLFALYSKLPGVTPTGRVRPMGITMMHGKFEALYRFPQGLTHEQFGEALQSVSDSFEALAQRGPVVVMLDYDTASRTWLENRDAGDFLTWARQQREETTGQGTAE